jgi:hypothetical protein
VAFFRVSFSLVSLRSSGDYHSVLFFWVSLY